MRFDALPEAHSLQLRTPHCRKKIGRVPFFGAEIILFLGAEAEKPMSGPLGGNGLSDRAAGKSAAQNDVNALSACGLWLSGFVSRRA
jgi:hypothetical protein